MARKLFKIAGLVIIVAALTAPVATAMQIQGDDGSSTSAQPTTYVNTPGQDQGMQGTTVVTPNDRATQGVGQTSSDPGIGGQYGANLIKNAQNSHQRDLQAAKTFTLPLAPDDRAGTANTASTLVIPYLSHGIGVNAAQFSGTPVRPDNRTGLRGPGGTSTPSVATPVATPGGGFAWGTAGISAALLALIAVVLAVALTRNKGSKPGVAVS